MSDSNHAFIRAYTRVAQSETQNLKASTGIHTLPHDTIKRKSYEPEIVPAQHSSSVGSDNSEQPSPRPHVVFPSSMQHDLSDRRHTRIESETAFRLEADRGLHTFDTSPNSELFEQTIPSDTTSRNDSQESKRRPLSSYSRPEKPQPFRAAYEVDSFEWNPLIDAMVSSTAEELDFVTEHLLLQAHRGRTLLGVMGSQQEEGTTTATLCLARRLSTWKARLGLVDASFERPGLAEGLGIAPEFGWEEALRGEESLPEVLIQSQQDGIMLLPLSKPVDRFDSINLTAGIQPAANIGALNHHNDLTLIDLGASWNVPDGDRHFLRFVSRIGVSGILWVESLSKKTSQAKNQLREQLHSIGIPILGIIRNESQ